MATTKVRNYNITPYYDDFDETKNYHRILFKPGFAVQARELTQLQTSLQNQIDKVGQAFYGDGDRVLGGKGTLLAGNKFEYIKLNPQHSGTNIASYVSEFAGTKITEVSISSKAHASFTESKTGLFRCS